MQNTKRKKKREVTFPLTSEYWGTPGVYHYSIPPSFNLSLILEENIAWVLVHYLHKFKKNSNLDSCRKYNFVHPKQACFLENNQRNYSFGTDPYIKIVFGFVCKQRVPFLHRKG